MSSPEVSELEFLRAENARLEKALAHANANLSNEVARGRVLKTRPDLPFERIDIYDRWKRDQDTIQQFYTMAGLPPQVDNHQSLLDTINSQYMSNLMVEALYTDPNYQDLSPQQVRDSLQQAGITSATVTKKDILRLRLHLEQHLIASDIFEGTCRLSKMKANWRVINIDCSYFTDREAVAFPEHSDFIPFAGWSSTKNCQPILRATMAWIRETVLSRAAAGASE